MLSEVVVPLPNGFDFEGVIDKKRIDRSAGLITPSMPNSVLQPEVRHWPSMPIALPIPAHGCLSASLSARFASPPLSIPR